MSNKLFVLAFLGLLTLVVAEDRIKKTIENLKASRIEAERALTREQSADINGIRSQLQDYEKQIGFFNVNEPLFKVPDTYYIKVIKTLIDGKRQSDDTHSSRSERNAFYTENFEKLVYEPCEIINKAYLSSLPGYYRQAEETPDLGSKVMALDEEDYEWLVNAGVCYNIVQDTFQMFSADFEVSD